MLVTASGSASASDELRELRDWLVADDDFLGRVHPVEGAVTPGHLGPVLEALNVVLASTAGPLATLLIAWLRHRRGDVTVVVTRPDGASLTLEAQRYRNLTPDELAKLTEEAISQLEALQDVPEEETDGRPRRA